MVANLRIHSLETFGTSDGPGIRLVVFTQGCLFRCLYCHNPDSQNLVSELARDLPVSELLEQLENQRPYFKHAGGVTFSGGEPTVQAETLLQYVPQLQKAGFHVVLDTCGAIVNDAVRALYDLVDLVILDVKHIDPTWHQKLTGHTNNNVLANALHREKLHKPLWLRYVLVPGYTDQPEFLEQWAVHFQPYQSVERVEILPYHTLGVHKYEKLGREYALAGVEPPTAVQIETAALIFRRYFNQVIIH